MPTQTTNTDYASSVPKWLDQYYQDLALRTKNATEQPYAQYGGPRVATFTGDQNTAMDMNRQNAGVAQGMINNTAMPLFNQAMQAPTQAGIQQYMNPYDNLVTQNVMGEMDRRHTINQQGIGDAARAASAFGGSRHGIIEAEGNRNHEQAVNQMLAERNQASYASGLGQFNTQQGMALQGANQAVGMAGAMQQYGQNDANQLMTQGNMQQGINQQSLDTAYSDFQRQQNYPYEQIGFQSGILHGTPTPGLVPTQTQTNTPGPSTAAQVAGGAVAGYGIYNMFK